MASVSGGLLSGRILSAVSASYGYSQWQGVFFAEAIPSLVFGVAILFYLGNRVEEARWLDEGGGPSSVKLTNSGERWRVPVTTKIQDRRRCSPVVELSRRPL
jgi:hypothetical protein